MRVLCIDDEPTILRVVKRLLPEHEVTCYVDSRAALALLVGEGRPEFEAIVCDLMMPYCSGVDVYHALSIHRPDLAPRIVFFTGVGIMPGVDVFLDSVPNPRIAKPFTRSELLAALVAACPA